ncbi:GNAT family N-acetyltransferase [Tumebacillus algifaecis]|nr:GNAT family N-acetyltransferase [Tumebacillus algifaecis]
MQIRVAQEQDQPYLVREYLQHLSPHLGEAERYAWQHLQVERALLLEDKGFVVGFASWGRREGVRAGLAQLTGIRIIATRRQQGHGTELFHAVLQDMEAYYADLDSALRRVFLFSPEATAPFFARLGFAQRAVLNDHRAVNQTDILQILDR